MLLKCTACMGRSSQPVPPYKSCKATPIPTWRSCAVMLPTWRVAQERLLQRSLTSVLRPNS
jgi:hypothetical protein